MYNAHTELIPYYSCPNPNIYLKHILVRYFGSFRTYSAAKPDVNGDAPISAGMGPCLTKPKKSVVFEEAPYLNSSVFAHASNS